MSGISSRELRALAGVLLGYGCLGGALRASELRWQHTGSLPRGLYRVDRHAAVRRGGIVLWCLDAVRGRWARERGYLTRGDCPGEVETLGKVVLATAGDTIDWSPDGLRRNGCPIAQTAPSLADHAGRPLTPVPFGRYVLRPRTVWLYSPYSARSLDSRYFGAVPLAWVRAVVVPVLRSDPP